MDLRNRFRRTTSEPLLDLGTLANGRLFHVPFSAFDRHGLVVGPTGMGKTRLLQLFNLEVAEKHRDVALVAIGPKGSFAPDLRRECYRRGWRRRVTYIDFSERRRLPGVNVIRPWGDDYLQAKVQREALARSMGLVDLSETPRFARYAFAGLYGAIAARLTMREAALVLDDVDGGVRQAVIERLPACGARRDLERLQLMAGRLGQAGVTRFFEEQVGSTLGRLRLLTENPVLGLMLGTQRSLSWEELLAPGRIVIVNADLGESLDREDQRYLVMAMLADLARTCFSRSPERRVRVSLTLDEAGWFPTSVLADILDRGREYRISLLGAAQYLSQFVDPKTQDRRLLDSFLTDTLVKVVFGALAPSDARELAALLHEHLLDADKVQLEVRTLRQLQGVVTTRSVTRGRWNGVTHSQTDTHTVAEGESITESASRATGAAHSHGTTNMSGSGSGLGSLSGSSMSHAVAQNAALGLDAVTDASGSMDARSSLESDFSAEGESTSASEMEIEAVGTATSLSRVEADAFSRGIAVSDGTSQAVSEGPMVQPGRPFREVTSITIEPLLTQLHRHSAAMVRQPERRALIAVGKEPPIAFRVADVPDPKLTEGQALTLDLDMMNAHRFFSTTQEIEAEIAARHERLLEEVGVRARVADEPLSVAELHRNLAEAGVLALERSRRPAKSAERKSA